LKDAKVKLGVEWFLEGRRRDKIIINRSIEGKAEYEVVW
jgi:hypothetical protein